MWWPWRRRWANQAQVAAETEVAEQEAEKPKELKEDEEVEGQDAPKQYFISHAYADGAAREGLLARLPAGMAPFIFPRITVPPPQMVSDRLLDAIRGCDGLVYLLGGMSARSFWVALERDYALRMGKLVFAYDPATGALTRDTSAPLTLNAFISYAQADREAGKRIGEEMRRRYFGPLDMPPLLRAGEPFDEVLTQTIERVIASGNYAIALWSARSAASPYAVTERRTTDRLWRDRVVYGLLDRTPLPPSETQIEATQLYGDAERPSAQRIDDLIVRLYWLVYRNTRQNALG